MAVRRERTRPNRSAQPVRGRTTGDLGDLCGAGRAGGGAGAAGADVSAGSFNCSGAVGRTGDVAGASAVGLPAVEARDLRKSFPAPGGELIEILHGVSCAMMPGRMTALVGPSGSGKSTALLCLAGLEAATSGQVSLMGCDLGGLPAARVAELYRDRVGFVFQAYNLLPYLTVRENLTISDTLAGRRPESARVREVLAGLGLEARADAVATTLSGGEQQRVALGRVLYRRPPVVFADEPTGALDTRSAAFVLAELRRLADDGAAVILVTHDLGAAALAESVLIMRDGRIVDRRRGATPDELLAAVNQTGAAA